MSVGLLLDMAVSGDPDRVARGLRPRPPDYR